MSTINPNTPASNPQLTGILSTVPMPQVVFNPFSSVNVGADAGIFSIPSLTQPGVHNGGGQVVVGGGENGAPANGAQPAAPNDLGGVPATGATAVPVTTTPATAGSRTVPEHGSPLAKPISGFGKASRSEPIRASIDGASFGFPSFKATAKTNTAPAIQWGPGWKRVEKNGMWWMEHTNGSKAVPAVEYRITPKPADKVQTIKVANGWGKKFPDGSILVFDRKEGPYRLDPKGNKHKVGLGNITIGGVKVRVFEASVVRTLDKNGKVDVFDSRGNVSKGTSRWNEALGAADAGASMGGGKADGGGAPGKTVGSGAAVPTFDVLTQDVEALTGIARGILDEIRSGSVDPAKLASLQAQLSKLPSGILQAAGAAGTMVSDGTTVAQPPGPNSTDVGGVNGGGVTPPTPGVDANATSKELAAGASAKVSVELPTDLEGRQARFAQLPEEIQSAVAAAFGSDRGTAAFKPDQLLAFSKDGTVRLVEGGTVYLRHESQVRGAGPGEDRALTMRPNRQPRSASAPAAISGGGSSGASSASGAPRPSAAGGAATVAGGAASGATRISLYPAGGETRHVDFGGLNGSYTWRTLPPEGRAALLEILRTGDEAASKAFASRTGSGWSIDPNAVIVIDSGFASFPNGLALIRNQQQATGTPPVAGGGASAGQSGSGRPPASTGGSISPGTAPPVPTEPSAGSGGGVGNGGGAGSGHAHAH